jgi:RHS repeat-associated protein
MNEVTICISNEKVIIILSKKRTAIAAYSNISVITDRRLYEKGEDGSQYYVPDVVSATDYYPFGWAMPGRTYTAAGANYKYGFNGKENDNEVKGEGNQQDYGMRIYDPRVGRFLSVDPISKEYPELTPYQFASNSPIDGIDFDGLEYTRAGGTPASGTTPARDQSAPYIIQSAPKRPQITISQDNSARIAFDNQVGENIKNGFLASVAYQVTGSEQAAFDMGKWDNLLNAAGSFTLTNSPKKNGREYVQKIIDEGNQGKHIVGHNNYKGNEGIRSVLKENPKALLDKFHSGNIVKSQELNKVKTRVDFGIKIGDFVNDKTGKVTPSTNGMIISGKNGAHIVPSAPNKSKKP